MEGSESEVDEGEGKGKNDEIKNSNLSFYELKIIRYRIIFVNSMLTMQQKEPFNTLNIIK